MIAPILLIVGSIASIVLNSWLPVVGALIISVVVHEFLLYDVHRHILNLEDING